MLFFLITIFFYFFFILQNWRRCLVKFVAIKSKQNYLRMNFCNRLSDGRFSTPFVSILLNPLNLRLKRSYKIGDRKQVAYILSVVWYHSSGDKCKILFAFKNKVNYHAHKQVIRLFVENLNDSDRLLADKVALRDLLDIDDDDYLGKTGEEDLAKLEYEQFDFDLKSDDARPNYYNHETDLTNGKRKRNRNDSDDSKKRWTLRELFLRFTQKNGNIST